MKIVIVKLKRVEPLTKYEKHFKRYNSKIHRVGWKTWALKENYDYAVKNINKKDGHKNLHPEDNAYKINFDVTKFKKI